MNVTYARAISLAVPVFVGLIALEFLLDRLCGPRSYRLADSINSLSCGILSTGVRVFFGFIGLFFYEWVLRHAPLHLPAAHWGTWVFAFLAYDLCYYWNHRLSHTVGLFWASHVVHHQSEEFNLTTALRQTGTGAFTNWVFYLPLALCGVPLAVFLLVGVVQLFYQFWPHTQQIGRLGILDRLVQTPSNHRVHHAQNDLYLDRNYVGVFTLWDHLFGTFQEELDEEPCIYGIRGQLKSWNPVWANLHYFHAMALNTGRAKSWRDRLRIWFGPPGWHPPGDPAPAYDPRRDFVKYDPPRTLALSLYVLVQFVALMALNSRFLALLPKQPLLLNFAWFGFILWGLVSLGGLLENRRAFVGLEAARVAAGGLGAAAGLAAASAAWLAIIFAVASMIALWRVILRRECTLSEKSSSSPNCGSTPPAAWSPPPPI